MPFCPQCRDDFQDWVTICPDCNIRLVSKLPPLSKSVKPVKHQTEELVTVATFPGTEAAYVASSKLQSEGVWSFVADRNISLYMGGSVKLQVRQRDLNRAVKILDVKVARDDDL